MNKKSATFVCEWVSQFPTYKEEMRFTHYISRSTTRNYAIDIRLLGLQLVHYS